MREIDKDRIEILKVALLLGIFIQLTFIILKL